MTTPDKIKKELLLTSELIDIANQYRNDQITEDELQDILQGLIHLHVTNHK